jgi:hypothetical protein
MPDLDLIDRLVATYRILNHTVRQRPEAELAQGGGSAKEILRKLRNDELRFSQDLKARISGQPVGFADLGEEATLAVDTSHNSTAELIAQFGTARESTLAMLRTLPEDQWDVTGDYPRSIRTEVFELVDHDRQVLDAIGRAVGESLVEVAPA